MHRRNYLLVGIFLAAMLATVGVTGCTADQLKAVEGVIQNIDTVSGNVTVKMKDGSTQTFNFTDVKAETIEQALGSLSIEPGDKVTIKEDKNGEVKGLEVRKAEVEGIIKSLGTDNVTIATKKGDITLQVTSETRIRIEDKGNTILSDLKVGQQVEAKYDVGSLKALKIEVESDDEAEGELQGTIKSIDTTNTTVTITTEKRGDITLEITPETVIRIEDKGTVAFADLKVGQQVEAKYDVGSLKALKIKVDDEDVDDGDTDEEDEEDKEDEDISENNDDNNFEIKGTIESFSSDGNSIVVNGQTIIIRGAEIEGVLTVGATVEAEVTTQSDGSLIAQEIEVEGDDD